jgi:hypothetical protein
MGPQHVPPSASKGVRACIICERSRRGEVESFLKALTDGHNAHRALKQTWKIGDLTFTRFEAEGPTAADYEKACRAAIDEGSAWQLALVQVPSGTSELVGDQNPYLVTKAKFLGRNVPVQEFRVETMQKPKDQLQWALGGIGLQVFAKLGGVPGRFRRKPRSTSVLGLGSANPTASSAIGNESSADHGPAATGGTAHGDVEDGHTRTTRTQSSTALSAPSSERTDMAWRGGPGSP